MERRVGIDRYLKIDTIGPRDKQGKIDAIDRRADTCRETPAMDRPILFFASGSAHGRIGAIPIQGTDGHNEDCLHNRRSGQDL